MPIHLYIEHLLNIRTLSIQASLPTSSTETTRASIAADKSILTLTHNDETASIKLPLNLSPNKESKISLDIPPVPQKELSFRVQLEEKEGSELTSGLVREDGVVTPWTADQLKSTVALSCNECGSAVLERGKIQQWKDLPSEGWAEMMDFWHCHKPDHPDGPHAHGADGELKKGYTADSKLALEPGVGMVDALNFVFVPEDCSNLKIVEASRSTRLLCRKASCGAQLGSIDPSTPEGYKLHKSSLSLSMSEGAPAVCFARSKWHSLHILTAVDAQGVRKFSVRLPAQKEQRRRQAKLWIFTPDLLVSTSALQSNEPVRVSKILWQEEDVPEGDDGDAVAERLSRQALSEGNLSLSEGEAESLVGLLKESADWLPEASRKFGEWNVALLERFSKTDLGPGI